MQGATGQCFLLPGYPENNTAVILPGKPATIRSNRMRNHPSKQFKLVAVLPRRNTAYPEPVPLYGGLSDPVRYTAG